MGATVIREWSPAGELVDHVDEACLREALRATLVLRPPATIPQGARDQGGYNDGFLVGYRMALLEVHGTVLQHVKAP